MPLTDFAIQHTKPSAKAKRLWDGFGLYLEITPAGGRYWRIKYRFAGKEKRLSLGVYPFVTLQKARLGRDDIRRQLANGDDPSQTRKTVKAARTMTEGGSFEMVALEWYAKWESTWSASHAITVKRRLEKYIFPAIGGRAIADLTSADLRVMVEPLDRRVAVTGNRVVGICGQVCRFAITSGRLAHDPTPALRGRMPSPKAQHFAAVTKPGDVAMLLRMLDGFQGTQVVESALKLAPLVFVRPGEFRKAKWADINLETAPFQWNYLVTKTDFGPHLVPLSSQAVAILRSLHLLTGTGLYVFPGARSKARPMSENAVNNAMRRMGIGKDVMCGHGFRAMARTILDQVLGFPPHLIEHQLAHTVKDANGRAYNRTTHVAERTLMMQAWGDYLDSLRVGCDHGN